MAMFVYVTFPSRAEAERICKGAVEGRLAACANILAAHQSYYWWDGAVQSEAECAAILKTTQSGFQALNNYIVVAHSYDVPCVVALPIDQGNAPYMKWISEQIQ